MAPCVFFVKPVLGIRKYVQVKENDVLIGLNGGRWDGDETGEATGNGYSGLLYHSLLYVGEIFHNTNFKNIYNINV